MREVNDLPFAGASRKESAAVSSCLPRRAGGIAAALTL
jgi:hypothetical protein